VNDDDASMAPSSISPTVAPAPTETSIPGEWIIWFVCV
jgi:hypothetical protein